MDQYKTAAYTHSSRSSCQLEYREIYVIFSKLTSSASISIVADSLMQLIFIGYGILHQIINEPVTASHLGCHILNKFLVLIPGLSSCCIFFILADTRGMGKPELHKNSKRFGHCIDITFQTGGMTAKPVRPSQPLLSKASS
jgi:hypothetical protein